MSNSTPAAVYLYYGPDEGARQHRIEALRKTLKQAKDLEQRHCYAFETNAKAVVAELRNGLLFASHLLVIYDEIDQLTTKASRAELINYLQHPSPQATLILASNSYRIADELKRNVPKAQQAICWLPFDSAKRGQVATICHRSEVTITRDATETLLQHVINTSYDLERIVRQLCDYVGSGGTIDVDLIDSYLFHSKEESPLSLFDNLAACNLTEAIETTALLLETGDAPRLLIILLEQFRLLYSLQHRLEQGKDLVESCRLSNIMGKLRQRSFKTAADNYSPSQVSKIIALGTEYAHRLRLFHGSLGRELIYQFIYYVIVKRGTAPALLAIIR